MRAGLWRDDAGEPVTLVLGVGWESDADSWLRSSETVSIPAEALVPLRTMFDYSDKIRSLTQGRASWTMAPHAYAPAPEEVQRGMQHPEDYF